MLIVNRNSKRFGFTLMLEMSQRVIKSATCRERRARVRVVMDRGGSLGLIALAFGFLTGDSTNNFRWRKRLYGGSSSVAVSERLNC